MPYRLLHFSLFLIMFPALFTGFFPGKIAIVSFVCHGLYVLFILYFARRLRPKEFDALWVILFFVFFSLISYLRGIIFNVYDFRSLTFISGGFYSLVTLPFWMLLVSPLHLLVVWRSFLTVGVLMCILLAIYPPTHSMDTMQHNMLWLNVFLLLLPYLKPRQFILVVIGALVVATWNLDRRSILVGYVVPVVILVAYRLLRRVLVSKVFFWACVAVPLVCLSMFVSGSFNVFQYIEEENEDVRLVSDSEEGRYMRPLFTDSRTGIVQQVVDGVFNTKEWWKPWVGLGANGRVRTKADSTYGMKGWRTEQESGMLNYIQSGGIWGMVAYGMLWLVGAWLCMFHSKNHFMRMLGCFMLFKYVFSFVEDQVSVNGHSFAQFLWIGMAFHKAFRAKTDIQMKRYVQTLLSLPALNKAFIGSLNIAVRKTTMSKQKSIHINTWKRDGRKNNPVAIGPAS